MSTVVGVRRAGRHAPREGRGWFPGMPWTAAAVLLLGLVLALRAWVLTPYEVVSDSMAPTLEEGSTVMVDRLSVRWDAPEHQELVLFDTDDGPVIKRVVGLAGDTVRIEDAVLHVNGEPVDEPYVDLRTLDGVFFGPVVVGPDELFVLGDNRFDSIDSRTYGPIPVAAVRGRVLNP